MQSRRARICRELISSKTGLSETAKYTETGPLVYVIQFERKCSEPVMKIFCFTTGIKSRKVRGELLAVMIFVKHNTKMVQVDRSQYVVSIGYPYTYFLKHKCSQN